MHYAAVLKGDADVLKNIAPYFLGDDARIIKLGEVWALASSEFGSCDRPRDVFPFADALLARIHHVLALYSGPHGPLSVHYIESFDAEGKPSKRGIRGILPLSIYNAEGLAELKRLRGDESLVSNILRRSVSDPAMREALSIWGEKGVGWSQIYDVIEFLGGPHRIAEAGWAPKMRTREVRQTANHYRHLGNRKKYPLPVAAPLITEARAFAANLLKQWVRQS